MQVDHGEVRIDTFVQGLGLGMRQWEVIIHCPSCPLTWHIGQQQSTSWLLSVPGQLLVRVLLMAQAPHLCLYRVPPCIFGSASLAPTLLCPVECPPRNSLSLCFLMTCHIYHCHLCAMIRWLLDMLSCLHSISRFLLILFQLITISWQHYTLNVWSQGKQLVLFLRELRGSRENKTN